MADVLLKPQTQNLRLTEPPASQKLRPLVLIMALLLITGLTVGVVRAASIRMATTGGRMVYGAEAMMDPKKHGSCTGPVQKNLRWGCDGETSDRICCFNRHYAEYSGFWETTSFLKTKRTIIKKKKKKQTADQTKTVFRDPVSGKPLFIAPIGRSWEDFVAESRRHGWPSFRGAEVVWENVRVLGNGETISTDGTHLGHNLPDGKGARYCINLVSVAGHNPTGGDDDDDSDATPPAAPA